MQRESGFYWVKGTSAPYPGGWMVVEWQDGRWWAPGTTFNPGFDDEDIGDRITPPEEK